MEPAGRVELPPCLIAVMLTEYPDQILGNSSKNLSKLADIYATKIGIIGV